VIVILLLCASTSINARRPSARRPAGKQRTPSASIHPSIAVVEPSGDIQRGNHALFQQ
jgi:hypothetical protein